MNGNQRRRENDISSRQRDAEALVGAGRLLIDRGELAAALEPLGEVVRRFGADDDPEIQLEVARALANRGFVLGELGQLSDEISAYDDLVARFGRERDEAFLEQVVFALTNKGYALEVAGTAEEALRVYAAVLEIVDEADVRSVDGVRAAYRQGRVLQQIGKLVDSIAAYDKAITSVDATLADDPAARDIVIQSFSFKALALTELGETRRALETYALIRDRFGNETGSAREDVALASLNGASLLTELGEPDLALQMLDELVIRLDEEPDADLRVVLARSLTAKGYTLAVVCRQFVEGSTAYERVIEDFFGDDDPRIQEQVARSMIGKAWAALQLGDTENAIETYRACVDQFGSADDSRVRAQAARALHDLAGTIVKLGDRSRAAAIYDELIARFRQDESEQVKKEVARAREEKETWC